MIMKILFAAFLLLLSSPCFSQTVPSQSVFEDAEKMVREKNFSDFLKDRLSEQHSPDFYQTTRNNVFYNTLRESIARKETDWLLQKDKEGNTPLMLAAYHGMFDIVEILLTVPDVRESVNATNTKGMSAWLFSTYAFGMTTPLCQPELGNDVSFVFDLMSKSNYYTNSPNPYKMTRDILEQNGALGNMEDAKRGWRVVCPKSTVSLMGTRDLQDTLFFSTVLFWQKHAEKPFSFKD